MMTEIGCIADDYTGGTDVAAGLRRAGLRVALVFGVPTSGQALPPCDAVVVAMKFRTTSVEKASDDVSAAYDWLTSQGVRRFYYKYCSTFDSTSEGNIGHITDLLLRLTGMRTSVISPSSPVHGRTVYQGHLFVGDRLLGGSWSRRSMGRAHPRSARHRDGDPRRRRVGRSPCCAGRSQHPGRDRLRRSRTRPGGQLLRGDPRAGLGSEDGLSEPQARPGADP